MKGQVEVIWWTLCNIAHSLMAHAQFFEAYIIFSLVYTADHTFPVLQTKNLINEDGKPTTPFKIATGTKISISH